MLIKKINLNNAFKKTSNLSNRLFATLNNELSIPSKFYKSSNKLLHI